MFIMSEMLRSDKVERPGSYWYEDDGMGSPREKVQVVRVRGQLLVQFRDDENGSALLDLAPLAGRFESIWLFPPNPSKR